jgi:hypothetical protein
MSKIGRWQWVLSIAGFFVVNQAIVRRGGREKRRVITFVVGSLVAVDKARGGCRKIIRRQLLI